VGRWTTIADVLRRPRSPISPVTARRPLPSLFVTAVTVIIVYGRSLPSSCRDVVVDAVVRRSRVAEISYSSSSSPHYNTVSVADRRAMLSRDSFRVDRNRRDGPSAAERAVALLSVRVYDRPDMDVPNYYPGGPSSSSVGRLAASCSSASASSATGPRRNAAHVHRRACARRGAMRRAYSTPPSKVRTSRLYNIILRRCSVVLTYTMN